MEEEKAALLKKTQAQRLADKERLNSEMATLEKRLKEKYSSQQTDSEFELKEAEDKAYERGKVCGGWYCTSYILRAVAAVITVPCSDCVFATLEIRCATD
jgi:hypothetical protein